mgnify:CR=1 FL=1
MIHLTGLLATKPGATASQTALDQGRTDINTKSDSEEIFEEISPIEDFSGTMSLSFRDHRFEPPKNTVDECKERDVTYAAPLFVTAGVHEQRDRRDQEPDGLHGRLPADDRQGHFRHQRHRAGRRVPTGPLARASTSSRPPDKTSDKDIFTCKMIPSRGAWLEFEIDKRDMVGVRLDRKRKQNVTVLLKALGWTDAQILEQFGEYESMRLTLEKDHTTTQDEALLDIYRKLRPGEPPTREAAQALLENYYFNPKRYDLAKVGRYKINKKLGLELPFDRHGADHRGHRRCDPLRGRTARGQRRRWILRVASCWSKRTTSTTSAIGGCVRSAS